MNIKDYVIKHSAGNLYWKDRESRYLGCNDHFSKIAKLNNPSDIVGKSDYELFSEYLGDDGINDILEVDKEVIYNDKDIICEETGVDQDGKKAYFLTKKTPLKDKDGNIVGLIGTSIDITKQKMADKTQAEFISNMEHDLRTPFSGIYSITSELLQIETDEIKKEYLGMIVDSAKVLLDYCNDVLNFSKVLSQDSAIQDNKFDIKKMISNIQKVEKPAAESKKIQLNIKIDENIPNIVISDYQRMNRIIFNIVGNAIKFTETGTVSIIANLIDKTDKTAIIRIIVKDTGIGISNDFKEYIFENFSKQMQSNKGKYKGLGVGLRVVKQYMREISGEIDLISQQAVGTEFSLTIPFKLPLTNDYSLN
jgi:signal transduction histidine kinase